MKVEPEKQYANDTTAIRSALAEFMPRMSVSPDWRVMLAGAQNAAATTTTKAPSTPATFFQQHKLKIVAGVAVLGLFLLFKGR